MFVPVIINAYFIFCFARYTVVAKVSRLRSTLLAELGLDTYSITTVYDQVITTLLIRIAKTLRAATPRVFFVHLKAVLR